MDVRGLAAVVATMLATVGALPQLRRLLTSRDVAGLSISSATLGVGTELAWTWYAVREELWLAVPEAVIMASTNGLLAVVMLRAGAAARRALLSGMAWVATLIATSAVWGSIGLGALLAVAYIVQIAPAIWCVYRVALPSGVAVETWILIGIESVLWGLYGRWSHDVACVAFGITGSAAAVAIVGRVLTTQWCRPASGAGNQPNPPGTPSQPSGSATPSQTATSSTATIRPNTTGHTAPEKYPPTPALRHHRVFARPFGRRGLWAAHPGRITIGSLVRFGRPTSR